MKLQIEDIHIWNTYTDKDTNLNAKEQSCNATNRP